MNPQLLDSQFETLEEPEGHLTIDASLPADEIVKSIRDQLGL
jgi:gluconate kinase